MEHPRMALAVTLLALSAAAGSLPAQQLSLTLLDTAVLKAPLLDESSGIVASRRRAGIFWSLNDSGNGPQLFATDSAGTDLGYVTVRGATNVDWEDLAIGPCTRSSGTCLFVADIGDNSARRADIRVYVVPEPEPPAASSDTERAVQPEDIIILHYPDHAHDAEALAVVDHTLFLVTKDKFNAALLFTADLTAPSVLLEARGPVGMRYSPLRGRLATGAAVSMDGKLVVVRTYSSINVFTVNGTSLVPLTDPSGLLIPVVETQGEGICFDAQGRLVLSGERGRRHHAILARLRLNGLPGS